MCSETWATRRRVSELSTQRWNVSAHRRHRQQHGAYVAQPYRETDAEKFDRDVAVNTAPLLIIRRALPTFRKLGGGAVVNIGSVNALAGAAYLLPYSVSKGGLATMSRNLANALAEEGVRINHLNVGWVTSPNEIALQESEGRPKGWEKNVSKAYAPTGRLLIPEEVAAHVVFWLSDMSKPVSGAVYEVEQYSVIGRNRNTNEK